MSEEITDQLATLLETISMSQNVHFTLPTYNFRSKIILEFGYNIYYT